jgi:Bax protein
MVFQPPSREEAAPGWLEIEEVAVDLNNIAPSIGKPTPSIGKPVPSIDKPVDVMLVPQSAAKLSATFRRIGYRLEAIRQGARPVPRVFVTVMPEDMVLLDSIEHRKTVFFKSMLPLALRVNEEIGEARRRLFDLRKRSGAGRKLSTVDRLWIEDMADRYEVKSANLDDLLRRVDVIPPSLALAQAAEESGWGTSRFAQKGKAVFGQRTFNQSPGLVPAERADGKRHKVKSFAKLLDGVRSYARNLNTHSAYREFRKMRAALRERNGEETAIDGLALAGTMLRYSERGAEYVRTIKIIIRTNELGQFDKARLGISGPDA